MADGIQVKEVAIVPGTAWPPGHQRVPLSLGREAAFPLCPGSTDESAPGQANYHIFVSG